VRKAENLPPSSVDVTDSGSLNLPEHSGPHRPVMGMIYLYIYIYIYIYDPGSSVGVTTIYGLDGPGIDLGTFRLVAQCLKHYASPGPVRIIWKF
jgi:hypothetical protein